jgi:hypothetical protein
MDRSLLPTLIFVPLVGFALYRRFKRTFGRQPLAPKRMIARAVFLGAVCVLLLVTSPHTREGLGAAAAGMFLGTILAVVGVRLTKIERTGEGTFYVPNGWIGLALTVLFVSRLAGRLFVLFERAPAGQVPQPPLAAVQRSPLTMGLFFLLAGYYVVYYAALLRAAGPRIDA